MLVLNVAYVFIRMIIIYSGRDLSAVDIVNSLICWGFMYYAYLGICEDFANKAGWNKASSDTALAGGHSLDLLAFTVIIQFGSLWSGKVWYGLLAIPIAIAYKMYVAFRGAASSLLGGGMDGSSPGTSAAGDATVKTKGSKSRRKEF